MNGVKFFWVPFFAIAVLLLVQGIIGSAVAGIFYVSPRGNDAQPGTERQPWQTLQHAVTTAQAGDIIFLKSGSYQEEVHLTKSGDLKTPLTLAAAPGGEGLCQGRQGKGGRTHLVSPAMAAAAAIEGHFVDIREWPYK